ncbi:MAG: hypothetical protein KW793_02545 [Candidatus Doudnabacteria bacterium]|nr:hypothetical protein [Candidatus Doudnabacteria bacterium]
MKVKLKSPGSTVVGLSRRELLIINNCLREACSGLLMDRFIPINDELSEMLSNFREMTTQEDVLKIKNFI